ncbi:MAG: bacteriophage holin [Simkaniaceae bacterium]
MRKTFFIEFKKKRSDREDMKENKKIKGQPFNIPSFTLALGITWSFSILMAGWLAAFGWGPPFVEVMGSFYIGYEPTFIGAIIGAIWAFFDGAIGGLIFSLFYNFFIVKLK